MYIVCVYIYIYDIQYLLQYYSILREFPKWRPWQLRQQSICLQRGRPRFDPWVGKIRWRRHWQPTPVFMPGKSHGQRSLMGYSPWGRKESDTTERLHFMCVAESLCCSPETITALLISYTPIQNKKKKVKKIFRYGKTEHKIYHHKPFKCIIQQS